MSSDANTPPYLAADLLPRYRALQLNGRPSMEPGLVALPGLPLVAPAMGITTSSAPTGPPAAAPEDPMTRHEMDDIPPSPTSDHASEQGRVLLPPQVPDDPEGPAVFVPAPASDMSRPVSPFRPAVAGPAHATVEDAPGDEPLGLPELYDEQGFPIEGPESEPDLAAYDPGPAQATYGPLRIDQRAGEAFRKRVRDALTGLDSDAPIPTLDSLMAMVDEISHVESRLRLLEAEVRRDRATLAHAVALSAKSEAAASEMRIGLQMEALRARVDGWKHPPDATRQAPPVAPAAMPGRSAAAAGTTSIPGIRTYPRPAGRMRGEKI